MTTGPASIEGVERMNVVVIREAGQGAGIPPRQDPYAMEIDWRRNYYACGSFGHMACHCRNQGQRGEVTEGRRLEYGRIKGNIEYSNNLKGEENLESLN